jgi:cobalt/nickel transport protein
MDKKKKNTVFIVIALFICLAIAFFLSPFASSNPDGLEKAAEKLGFLDLGEISTWGHAPMADYAIPFFGESRFSGMAAGLLGTLLVFGLGWGAGAILKRKKKGS